VTYDPIVRIGQSPGVPSPAVRKWRWPLLVGATVAVLLVVSGGLVVWRMVSPSSFTVAGDLTLTGTGIKFGSSTGSCIGQSGYQDIGVGTSIVISDAEGTTVAVGSLASEGKSTTNPDRLIRPIACTWNFTVRDVPEGSRFYGVSIGKRGTQQYSRGDLDKVIHLTLS
jgi:hypothetical protein